MAVPSPVLPPPPGKRKLWLFRLIGLVLIPILFFGILEAGLRCSGYGFPCSAIIQHSLEGKAVYCHNYKFGWRFFSRSLARHFEGFVFDTHKSPETYRIFVLGSSAAAGVPAQAYNFGRMLEVMLDELYPNMNFEVHTVAMPAINSHVVVEIAKDCARHQPDLFVVYTGNNEIVGPYGPGTVFAPLSPSLPLIRANIAFKSTRTGQLLDHAMQWIASRSKTELHWGGMEMFLDKQIRYNDPALEIAYRHFEANLRDICQTGLDAGAAVIVSNVCSNLKDSPPFASLHRMDITESEKHNWQDIYQAGAALEAEGRFEEAIVRYLDAEIIDATFADLQFRLGKCYWAKGDYPNAKERYVKAREYDALRFRADNRINDIIRAAADAEQQKNLFFVDGIKAMEAASPHGITGGELFYEHVHMNFRGNYILAKAMLPHIHKALPALGHSAVLQDFSEEDVARYLAYTDNERAVYLSIIYLSYFVRPPFTNQLYHEQRMADTKQQIETLLGRLHKGGIQACALQHQQAIQKRPDDWQLLFQYSAFLNSGLRDVKAEEAELRKVLQRCPYYAAYLNLGRNLFRQFRISESESILKELVNYNPSVLEAHIELASICRQRRDYQNEIGHLLRALRLDPKSMIVLYIHLANAYDKTGDPEKAIEVLYRAIRLFPEENTAQARAVLACLLYSRNDYENALKEMQSAVRINPDIRKNASYDTVLKSLEGRLN